MRSFRKMSFVSQTTDAHARSVTFLTDDSVHLRGTYWDPRENGHTSVLLLHDFRSDRSVWDPYIAAFRSRGWGILAVDLRGHGESVRQDMRADLLQPSESDLRSPLNYPNDVRASLAFLARQPKSDAGRLAMIGVGLGSDLAYAASGRGWGTASTVCISLDEGRAREVAGSGPFAPRSIYLLYGADDMLSAGAVPSFLQSASYPAEAHLYEGTASVGMALFSEKNPEILARSIAWIERTI